MSRYIDAEPLEHRSPKLRALILEQPTADVEPVRHGRWVRESVGSDNSSVGYFKITMAECSECGTCVTGKPNYCPNCGARMDGEEQENE